MTTDQTTIIDQPRYDHSDPRPSWSRIKHVLDCPADAKWAAENTIEQTASMAGGKLMHTAILEPHLLASEYVEPPEVVRVPGWEPVGSRKDGWTVPALPGEAWPTKAEAEAVCRPWGWAVGDGWSETYATAAEAKSALGRSVRGTWVAPGTLAEVERMVAPARRALRGVAGHSAEVPLYGQIEGVKARGCADVVLSSAGKEHLWILDVKTVSDVSPRAIARAAHAGRWHGQLGTYAALALQQSQWSHIPPASVHLGIMVVQAPTWGTGFTLSVSGRQKRPHARIEWLDAEATKYAHDQATKAWRLWRDCEATGIWPDYTGGLGVAKWQLSETGEVGDEEW